MTTKGLMGFHLLDIPEQENDFCPSAGGEVMATKYALRHGKKLQQDSSQLILKMVKHPCPNKRKRKEAVDYTDHDSAEIAVHLLKKA